MELTQRYVRLLDKRTGVVDQIQYLCPEEWTSEEVRQDIERDLDFVRILDVSHQPIAGFYGKIRGEGSQG